MTICTGSQIRAARALLGWSRQVLAEAASVHVNTVVYWEQQEEIPTGVYSEPHACRLIQQALVKAGVVFLLSPTPGVRFCQKTPISGAVREPARARVMGSKRLEIEKDNFVRRYGGHALDTDTNAPTPPSNDRRKSECGAKTRAGQPCRRRGSGRGGRCINHGGHSTGPKTVEGRQRIAEAQRRRWARNPNSDG